jgi:flagellar biosynthesis protein FlhA
MAAIVETIAAEAENTRDVHTTAEAVRRRFAPSICASLADQNGLIHSAALSLGLESRLATAIVQSERGPVIDLEPDAAAVLAQSLRAYEERRGGGAAIVCPQSRRLPLARFVEAYGGHLTVLGLGEIVPGYTLNVIETIGNT